MNRLWTDVTRPGGIRATVPPNIAERLLFVGGLHRSGTSLLHRMLAAHPQISSFAGTGVPEDEGQHLQTVFPPAKAHGGPGRFGFSPAAYLTEDSSLVSTENAEILLGDWVRYWDLSKLILIEKSPPNIIRARFLQTLFPKAAFVFLIRHPICVALATEKWSKTSPVELILHWAVVHRRFLADLTRLHRYQVVRYEDIVADPAGATARLFEFIGLPAKHVTYPVKDRNQPYLQRWQKDNRGDSNLLSGSGIEPLFRDFGYALEPPFVAGAVNQLFCHAS